MNMDKRSFIISGFFVGAIVLGFVLIPDSGNKELLILGIALSVCLGMLWLMRPRLSVQEMEIRKKIDQIKNAGHDLVYEYETDLSVEDLKKLKQHRLLNIFVLVFVMFLFGAIGLLSIHYLIEINGKVFLELGTVILLVIAFVYGAKASVKKIDDAIKAGKKTIVRGIVTNKRIESDDSDVYFLEIENIAITVKKRIYSKYRVGDGVEVHVLKNYYNHLLYENKIDSMTLK